MAKKMLIDYRYADVAKLYWGDRYEIIPSLKLEALAQPVRSHPDIALVQVGNTYVAEKTVYEAYKEMIS